MIQDGKGGEDGGFSPQDPTPPQMGEERAAGNCQTGFLRSPSTLGTDEQKAPRRKLGVQRAK